VAETLVALGVELRDVKTCSTLRAGLEECVRFLRSDLNRANRSQRAPSGAQEKAR